MIELKHLKKSFGNFVLFDDLNISFPDEGLFLLRGHNGCGKTTLLYILGLVDFDYEGSYFLDGKNLDIFKKKEVEQIKEKMISILFSKGNLIPFLNVKENIEMKVRDKTKIINFIPEVEAKRKINTLSGGEEILVALSHEVSLQKRIYLLDEITSALDDENVERIMNVLIELSKSSLVILTAHDERVLKFVSNIIDL